MGKDSSRREKMLREKCNIPIGLRISGRSYNLLQKYKEKKGINTDAGATRQLFTEKLNEEVGG